MVGLEVLELGVPFSLGEEEKAGKRKLLNGTASGLEPSLASPFLPSDESSCVDDVLDIETPSRTRRPLS